MAAKKPEDIRSRLLERAQERFERVFIAATLADVAKARTRLAKQFEKVSGSDASLRKKMITADMKRLDGIQRKTRATLKQSQSNFKSQLGGGGFETSAVGRSEPRAVSKKK